MYLNICLYLLSYIWENGVSYYIKELCNLSLEIQGPFVWRGVLRHGRKVPRWWPPLLWLSIQFGPYCMVQPDRIDPLFLQKKSVCVYHIYFQRYMDIMLVKCKQVLRILHQYFPFCINFRLNFRSNWSHFSLVLDLIDPSFLQNFTSDWVHFFYRVPNLPTENLVKYPPPTPGLSLIVLCMHIYLTIGNVYE